ncbi:RNA polymerase sigma factor [Sphingobacterium corticibacter]|uniref:RNA polymerase sigma-70 factor n=1 Tax=Sphingobacterium corticibacter TaxID=2171749 RepID=A0A2T8HM02_9SPHI|nr:sigma-70 family RNA polymerase sigma factor [Sphingobacterium corticibacter]PVH26475.1 RNA polymerase sigma-70 factor [Sphingobacterium corticibacter]
MSYTEQKEEVYQSILRLTQGDQLAFTDIYNVYSRKLFLHILTITKDKDTAEGLLQDVFMKVWDNRSSIDPDQSFQAWLYTIARNTVYSYFRQVAKDQKLQQQLYHHFDELYEVEMDGNLQDKQEELLGRALATLSERRRQVFQLCKIERKSYEEAAVLLGISTSTVSNLMVKANQEIRKFIQEHYGEILLFIIACHIK